MSIQPRSNARNFRFPLGVVVTGTAQVSTASTLTLAVADPAVANDEYNQMLAVITFHGTGGPPIGQRAIVTDFANATKIATIFCLDTADGKWGAVPQADTTYAIYAVLRSYPFIGLSQGGNVNAIILQDKESSKDGFYVGLDLDILDGPGAAVGHKFPIVKYTGATRTAYTLGTLLATPTAATRYRIQGHLYHPVTALKVTLSGGGNLKYSPNPAGLTQGAEHLSPSIDETELGNIGYLELAAEGAGQSVMIWRSE